MPFEPLRTDEPLEGDAPRPVDFERQLMAGCAAIVTGCLITFGLIVWPWLVFPEYSLVGLTRILAFGLGSATIFGVFLIRKAGTAGASAFMGGSMVGGVFIYLRLQQVLLARGSAQLPQPEYPDSWGWIVPAAWVVLAVVVTLVFFPWHEFEDQGPGDSSR